MWISLFHFRIHFETGLDTIYSHSTEGATALHRDNVELVEFVLSEHILFKIFDGWRNVPTSNR